MSDLIRKEDALAKIHWLSSADWTVAERRAAGAISDALAALPAVIVGVKPDRETFDAMCAMRDAINEFVPMPSLESDLLQGTENSVFCATVAEAVIAEIRRLRAALEPVAAPDPAAIWGAAQSLLDLHDGFLAGRDIDEDAARRLHVASSFGAAAFLSCPVGGGEASAMTRAFLLALINPLHPDLDYLRAGKRISEAKGAAE